MKRYDTLRFTEHRRNGSICYDLAEEDFKTVLDEYHDIYKVYVRCRKCGNHHEIADKCQVCDMETKIKWHI